MSSDTKYIGLDVHKEAISIAVLNEAGKLVMESIIETKAATIVQFLQGLRGELHVDPGRRNLGGLAVRFAETTGPPSGSVQSSPQCFTERR
jgi:hypothetical protein